jgi:hypothetical protein
LKKLGYPSGRVDAAQFFPDGSRAHCKIYLQLREIVQKHVESGERPILEECEKPIGAWNWELEQDASLVEEIDVYMEGRDELATVEDFNIIP